MRHYFRFLLSTADADDPAMEEFFQDIRAALRQCMPALELNLYTTADYREKILTEKLQRVFVECTDDTLPLLHDLLAAFPNIEVEPPPLDALICVAGTSRADRLALLSVLN